MLKIIKQLKDRNPKRILSSLLAVFIMYVAVKKGMLMPLLSPSTFNAVTSSGLLAIALFGVLFINLNKEESQKTSVKNSKKMLAAMLLLFSFSLLSSDNIYAAEGGNFKDIKAVATHVRDGIHKSALPMVGNIGGIVVLIYGIATLNRGAFTLGVIIIAFMYFFFGWIDANYSLGR